MPAFDRPDASSRSTSYWRSVSRATADPARGVMRASRAGSSTVSPTAAARTASTSTSSLVDDVLDR